MAQLKITENRQRGMTGIDKQVNKTEHFKNKNMDIRSVTNVALQISGEKAIEHKI